MYPVTAPPYLLHQNSRSLSPFSKLMASPMAFVSLHNGANLPKMICGVCGAKQSTFFKSSVSTRSPISGITEFLKINSNFGILKSSTNISSSRTTRRRFSSIQLYSSKGGSGNNSEQGNELDWPILQRWDVPWPWQTVSLTSLACGISFVLTGLVETAALPYLGIQIGELTMDDKAELLFVDQSITSAAVLGVLFSLTSSFRSEDDDLFRYDLREPFNLQKGWLLWAGIGLIGAIVAIALTGVAFSYFGESPKRETDALVSLLPLIGASPVSTACLVGITGILAPVLEETVFRGFFMVSLTRWVPTPVAIAISAAVFALAHLTPGEFPQLFVLGTALGISYAQTRNLLTSITIHSFWNSGVILLLTFLQLQGYDIRELLQASQ